MNPIKILFFISFVLCSNFCDAQNTIKTVSPYSKDIESDIIVKNQDTKERFRRRRKLKEQWSGYFCKVLLWPYDERRYNFLFATLNQGGCKVQFISKWIFEVDNQWILVLRGGRETVALMSKNITLESPRDKIWLSPVKTDIVKNLTDETWIGFVIFPKPEQPITEIMSSFAIFGNAGGVSGIVPEERIPDTEGFKIGVDFLDVIIKNEDEKT